VLSLGVDAGINPMGTHRKKDGHNEVVSGGIVIIIII
jgi:hypothetical protein